MSLMSSLSSSVTPRRSSSIASNAYTDACSDGYFSEVFDGEEIEDVNNTAPFSDTLTTLINAPLANFPSPSTISGNSKVFIISYHTMSYEILMTWSCL